MAGDRSPERPGARIRVAEALIATQGFLRSLFRWAVSGRAPLVVSLCIVTFAVLSGLKDSDVPNQADWQHFQTLEWIWIASAIPGLVAPVFLIWGLKRALTWHRRRVEVVKVCHEFVRLATEVGLPRDEVGVHVWVIRGRGVRYLDRYEEYAPRRMRRTGIMWRKGKGVLGMCWERDLPIVADLERLRELAPDQATFEKLPGSERFNLRWNEFERTRKYKAVLAIPLRSHDAHRPHLIGFATVDVFEAGYEATLEFVKSRDAFSSAVRLCEDTMGVSG